MASASSSGPATKSTESNAVLKLKFQKLHGTVAKSVNAANIIDFLFQEAVIGEADLYTLQAQADTRERCRNLLTLLHNSEHPAAFVQLYLAISNEPHVGWLIDRIDELTDPSIVSLQMQQMSVTEPTSTDDQTTRTAAQHALQRSITFIKTTEQRANSLCTGSHHRQFLSSAKLLYQLDVDSTVWGVTQLNDTVYMVCGLPSSKIRLFNATTHERLTDINVKDLINPYDITACHLTSRLYVCDADFCAECIFVVSSDGADIQRWLPKSPSQTFRPRTLSVKSSRLLVTSHDTNQLMQFDSAGGELSRVALPDYMEPWHAVESPTGSFIVSHYNEQLTQGQLSEVNAEGQVLRQFSGSLRNTPHIAVDSQGYIFVADFHNGRILLLDAQLALRRVIIDQHQLNDERPHRLCYNEQSGQLLVAFALSEIIAVFDVLQR